MQISEISEIPKIPGEELSPENFPEIPRAFPVKYNATELKSLFLFL